MRLVPADRLPVIDGPVARVALTQGQVAVIDAADAALVATHRWFAHWNPKIRGFYVVRNGSRAAESNEPTAVLLHRFLLGAGSGQVVDHRNHDTLDNRRANLRSATYVENQRNRQASTGSSGYMGVYRMADDRQRRPWNAKAQVAGQSRHVGYFATPVEAARARDAYLRDHHPSEFWTFNFPLPGEQGISHPLSERTPA